MLNLCSEQKRSYEADYIPVGTEEKVWSPTRTAHVTENHSCKKYTVQALVSKMEGFAEHVPYKKQDSFYAMCINKTSIN
jgi:hypothetical protein